MLEIEPTTAAAGQLVYNCSNHFTAVLTHEGTTQYCW